MKISRGVAGGHPYDPKRNGRCQWVLGGEFVDIFLLNMIIRNGMDASALRFLSKRNLYRTYQCF